MLLKMRCTKYVKISNQKVKILNIQLLIQMEKYLIKDKDGKVIKKSESLNFLIDRTSWNRLKLIK